MSVICVCVVFSFIFHILKKEIKLMESMWYDSSCCYNNIMHTKDVAEEIIPYYFWKVCQCNTIFSKAKASGTVLLLWKKKRSSFYNSYLRLFLSSEFILVRILQEEETHLASQNTTFYLTCVFTAKLNCLVPSVFLFVKF